MWPYLNVMFIYLFYTDLKTQLNVKTAEISELKIQLDDAKSSTNREILAQEDLQKHYQHRLKEKQTEIDSFKRCSVPFFCSFFSKYEYKSINSEIDIINTESPCISYSHLKVICLNRSFFTKLLKVVNLSSFSIIEEKISETCYSMYFTL